MTKLTPERLKELKTQHHLASEAVNDIMTEALVETYEALAGRKVTDRQREDIYYAIRT